jgi:hypothetical protein
MSTIIVVCKIYNAFSGARCYIPPTPLPPYTTTTTSGWNSDILGIPEFLKFNSEFRNLELRNLESTIH